MTRMHRTLLAAFVLSGIAIAQTKPTIQTRPATTPGITTVLPSEDTVNSFLFQMFGYDPTITWKVNEIRPSEIPGLAEVSVVLTNAQGSNPNRLLVSADGKRAISGDILPFGANPFDDARAKLETGVTGPRRGPAKDPVTLVESADRLSPPSQESAPTT